MVMLSKTKEVIFDVAVELIAGAGFGETNMREIAARSGIKAAAIYNHFSGKQEILDCIYSYYAEHFNDNVKSYEELRGILENGDMTGLVKAFLFTFESADEKKYRRMVLITKIIYMRIFYDPQAKDIFLNMMTASKENLTKRVLDSGVSSGILAPFDTESYAGLLGECRHIMGIKAFARPDYSVGQLEEEQKLISFFSGLLREAKER